MKNFLSALAGVMGIACTQPAGAQSTPCDVKGIRTTIANPKLGTGAYNPEYPPRTNTFNWFQGQQNGGMNWNLNNVAIGEPDIALPYYQTDNSFITHLQGKPDWPADGWELIKRDLGYNDAGTPITGTRNPYVVLYNKRSGMLRVFAAVGDLFNSYQLAEIKIVFNGNGTNYKAGTLNRMEGIGTALLDTPPGQGPEFASVNTYLNQRSKWFMADFPMEYDPCACQFDSKLKIEVNLVSQANVQLTGITTGTIASVNSANPAATQTSSGFDDALNMAKKVGNNLGKAQKTYKTIDKWANKTKETYGIIGTLSSVANANDKKSAIDALKAAMKTSNFLKNGLSAAPYIGFAVSAFDAFFGGGKTGSGTQPVELQPMAVETSTQTTGTITAPALYNTITFNNPGTRTITTPLEYPYYNEAMGVFSLLTSPVMEHINTSLFNDDGERVRQHQFQALEPLRYVINPASGLEVQDFEVALMVSTGPTYPDILPGNGWEYEGTQPMSTGSPHHLFRTSYTPSGCFLSSGFFLETKDRIHQANGSQVILSGSYWLKFIINLRRPGAPANEQNTLVVLRYPVSMVDVQQFTNIGVRPCTPTQPQAQASVSDVQALCSGSIYQAAVALRPAGSTGAGSSSPAALAAVAVAVADVAVYPNPATDAATIRFAAGAEGQASAYVLNMLGKRVLSIIQNEHVAAEVQEYSFPTAGLPAGLYRCVIETADGKRVSTPLSIVR